MSQAKPTLPLRLNLAPHRIYRLNATVRLEDGTALRDQLAGQLDDEGAFWSFVRYSRDKEPHLVSESAFADGTEFLVSLIYERGGSIPTSAVPKQYRKSGVIFEAMNAIGQEFTFACEAHFSFELEPRDALLNRLAFPLPLDLTSGDKDSDDVLPLDEVREISAIKRIPDGSGRVQYSVDLRLSPDDKRLVFTAGFGLSGPFWPGVAQAALNIALDIGRNVGVINGDQ